MFSPPKAVGLVWSGLVWSGLVWCKRSIQRHIKIGVLNKWIVTRVFTCAKCQVYMSLVLVLLFMFCHYSNDLIRPLH